MNFCPNCGSKNKEFKFCPNCGFKYLIDEVFDDELNTEIEEDIFVSLSSDEFKNKPKYQFYDFYNFDFYFKHNLPNDKCLYLKENITDSVLEPFISSFGDDYFFTRNFNWDYYTPYLFYKFPDSTNDKDAIFIGAFEKEGLAGYGEVIFIIRQNNIIIEDRFPIFEDNSKWTESTIVIKQLQSGDQYKEIEFKSNNLKIWELLYNFNLHFNRKRWIRPLKILEVYSGEIKNNELTGNGKSERYGDIYFGDFVDGYYDRGKLITSDGDVYEGEFMEGEWLDQLSNDDDFDDEEKEDENEDLEIDNDPLGIRE